MSHSCLYSQPLSITAVWTVLISRPAKGRRLSWPHAFDMSFSTPWHLICDLSQLSVGYCFCTSVYIHREVGCTAAMQTLPTLFKVKKRIKEVQGSGYRQIAVSLSTQHISGEITKKQTVVRTFAFREASSPKPSPGALSLDPTGTFVTQTAVSPTFESWLRRFSTLAH